MRFARQDQEGTQGEEEGRGLTRSLTDPGGGIPAAALSCSTPAIPSALREDGAAHPLRSHPLDKPTRTMAASFAFSPFTPGPLPSPLYAPFRRDDRRTGILKHQYMETANTVTPERIEGVIRWVNGEETQMQESEVRKAINDLIQSFRMKFRELHPAQHLPRLGSVTCHPLSLSALIAASDLPKQEGRKPEFQGEGLVKRVEPEKEEKAEEGETHPYSPEDKCGEAGASDAPAERPPYDSIVLINAISRVAIVAGYRLSMSKAQLILWCLYGSCLANGNRLEIEQPQVWKYGPVFPAAYRRGRICDRDVCEAAWKGLNEDAPEIAALLQAKTHAMMATPMKDLEAVHKSARSPYGKMTRKEPDKWGMRIPDEDIRAFFTK